MNVNGASIRYACGDALMIVCLLFAGEYNA